MFRPICSLLFLRFISAVSVLTSFSAVAQSLFNKAFTYEGYMGNLEPVTGPGGFMFCSTVRFGLGDIDGFQFTRLDSAGGVVHTKAYSTGPLVNVMQFGSLARMRSDGTYSFLFGSRIGSGYKWSVRIFNTSPEGTINWNRKLEYVDPDYSIYFIGAMEQAFEETPDGGYLITGLRKKPSSALTDTVAPMVAKLDGAGNVLWNKNYDLGQMCGWHIVSQVGPSGETLFGFHADTPCKAISNNCLLTKIDPNGNTLWSKRVDGFNGRLTGSAMVNGRYLVSAMDSASIYILNMDTAGVPLWGKRYTLSFPLWTWSAGIIPTNDHGLVLTALMPDSTGSSNVFFFKVDSLGSVQWQRAYGNMNYEGLVDLVQNGDSTFTMLTVTQIWDSSIRYYLSKLDSTGINNCILPTDGVMTETPITFSLVNVALDEFESPMISQALYVNDSLSYDPQMMDTCLFEVGVADLGRSDELLIYPSPTTGSTSVRVPVHLLGASLTIVDLFGKRIISTALSGTETLVDLSGLSSGVYLYQVVAPSGRTLSGRLIKE